MPELGATYPYTRNHGSKRFGWAFWLPSIWLALILTTALGADLLNLPDFGHIDAMHPTSPPGTIGKVTLIDCAGGFKEVDYVYWLGTDSLGRDILTRLIFGARVSLLIGIVAPALALLTGGTLGLLSGFYRGRLDTLVAVLMDVILAFPGLVLLLAIVFYFGPGLDKLILALSLIIIPAFYRVARANTLTWSKRNFILAARAYGAGELRILYSHILPNVFIPLTAYGFLLIAVMIIAEGALSFLGLGVPAPMPSWGGMIAEGKEVLDEAPYISLFPAIVMFLTVLSFNLLSDRIRELTDIRDGRR